VATDPAPGTEDKMRQYVEAAWAALTKIGLAPGASTSRLRFTADLKEAVAKSDLLIRVQEAKKQIEINLRPLGDANWVCAYTEPHGVQNAGENFVFDH
jgi:hypothetical protein